MTPRACAHPAACAQASTQRATASGYHAYDDQWPKLGAAEEANQIKDLRGRADALRIIAKSAPDKADPTEAGTDRPSVDARILADWVEAMAETLESVRPLETNASAVLMIIGYGVERLLAHPFAPLHQRMNSAAARLAQIPELLKVARGRLKSPSKASLENVQIVAAGLSKLLVSDVLKPDAKSLDGDAPLAQRVKESAAAAAKAIDAYAGEVKASYPVEKAENKPLGAAGWGKIARLREGVTESPAEVRAMGEAEIKRLNARHHPAIGRHRLAFRCARCERGPAFHHKLRERGVELVHHRLQHRELRLHRRLKGIGKVLVGAAD